jgi:hypothetical protein
MPQVEQWKLNFFRRCVKSPFIRYIITSMVIILFILRSDLFAARLKAETTTSASFFGRGLLGHAIKEVAEDFPVAPRILPRPARKKNLIPASLFFGEFSGRVIGHA